MSKITTVFAAVALLASGAAMAQGNDFNSMVVDYGQAPGLSAGKVAAVAQAPVAKKARTDVVTAQANTSNADAELGFFVPVARKQAPAATVLAGR